MIIADTSGLLALFNTAEPDHEQVAAAVTSSNTQLVVSPYVVAELDYLVASRIGVDAELAVLRELAGSAYHLATMDPDQLATAADLVVQVDYNNLTSLVVTGVLQPITGKTGAVQDDFTPSVWSQVTLAGNVYGVPQGIGPQVLFYRKDLFDRHGIGVPTTWDEYRPPPRS